MKTAEIIKIGITSIIEGALGALKGRRDSGDITEAEYREILQDVGHAWNLYNQEPIE